MNAVTINGRMVRYALLAAGWIGLYGTATAWAQQGAPTTQPAMRAPSAHMEPGMSSERDPLADGIPDDQATNGTEVNVHEPIDIPADIRLQADELEDVTDDQLKQWAEAARQSAVGQPAPEPGMPPTGAAPEPPSHRADRPGLRRPDRPLRHRDIRPRPGRPGEPPAMPDKPNPTDAITTDPATGELAIDPEEQKKWWRLGPEERPYLLVYNNTPFEAVCHDIEFMTGLSMVGLELIEDTKSIPPITFQSTEMMSFDDMLLTLNVMFMAERNYWILKRDGYLMIRQLSDWYRYTPWDHVFQELDKYRKADLPLWEYASVVVVPEKGSPEKLAEGATDVVPPMTAVAMVVEGTNWIELRGFCYYIEKQLKYIKDNDRAEDLHRKFKIYKLQNIDATEAAGLLEDMLVQPTVNITSAAGAPQPAQPAPRGRRNRRPRPPTPAPAGGDMLIGDSTADVVDIHPDDRNNQLLIKATPSKHEEVQEYLTQYIDVPAAGEMAELVTIKYADPQELADMIIPLIGQTRVVERQAPQAKPGQPQPPAPPPIVTTTTDAVMTPVPSLNALLVKANEGDMKLIRQYIEILDVEQAGAQYEIVELKFVSGSDLALVLNDVLGQSSNVRRRRRNAAQQDSKPFQALPNMNNERMLVLTGEQEDLDQAKTLIEKMDVKLDEHVAEKMVELVNAEPSAMAEILSTRFGGSSSGGGGGYRGYNPRRNYYRGGGGGGGGTELPQFIPEDESKLLIVLCHEEMWPDVERFIQQLDEKSRTARSNRIYRLEYANATTVYGIVQQIFNAGGGRRGFYGGGGSSSGPMIQQDPQQNTLIVAATDEDHKEIKELIDSLDQPGAEDKAEMHELQLANADVNAVKSKIEEIYEDRVESSSRGGRYNSFYYGRMSGGPEKTSIRLIAEPLSNRLLVSASPEDFEEIKSLVERMDNEYGQAKVERKLFEIKYVQPSVVQNAISTMFPVEGGSSSRSRWGGSSEPAPMGSVESWAVGETVIVSAPQDKMARIEELIGEVDANPVAGNEIRTYKVENAGYRGSADVANTLRDLYGLRQGAKSELQFLGQSGSDLLMVSAPSERMEEIDQRVQQVLEAQKGGDLSFVIKHFNIQYARPQDVADLISPILETKFQEMQSQGGGGRGYGYGQGPQITPHQSANKLMVAAPAELMDLAESLIKEFDAEPRTSVTSIVTLDKAEAVDIVPVVQQMMTDESSPATSRRGYRSRRRFFMPSVSTSSTDNELTVVQVGQSNSIMLRGPQDRVTAAEEMIRKLDDKAEPQGPMLKVVDLEYADRYEVEEMIEDLLGGGGGYGYGSNLPEDVVVKSDYASGKLIISAPRDKMPMIEHIIEVKEGMAKAVVDATGEQPIGTGVLIGTDKYGANTRAFEIGPGKDGKRPDVNLMAEELAKQLEAYFGYWDAPIVKSFPYTNQIIITGMPEQFKLVSQLLEKLQANPPRPPMMMRVVRLDAGVPADRVIQALERSLSPEQRKQIDFKRMERDRSGGDPLNMIREVNYYDPIEQPKPREKAAGQPTTQAAPFVPSGELARMQRSLSALSWAQATATQPAATTQPAASDQPSLPDDMAPGGEMSARVQYDPETGVIYLVGPSTQLEQIEGVMDKIIEQYQEMTPEVSGEIRVFRVNYVEVSVAAAILEQMFNDKSSGARQGAQPKAEPKQPQPKQPSKGEEEGEGTLRDLRERQAQEKEAEEQAKRASLGGDRIRVVPDPRTQTLIIRAMEEDFPAIVELLLKIDRPGEKPPVNIEIFQLKKLNAYDVEQAIKAILKIDQRQQRSMPMIPRGGRGSGMQQAQMIEQLQAQMLEMQAGEGEEGLKINPAKDITLTSDSVTNSIIVSAPEEGMKLVRNLINELEEQQTPILIETRVLKNSDAVKVATELEKLFPAGRPSGGRDGEGPPSQMGAVKIAADARTNKLIIRALEPDMERIRTLIDEMDQDTLQDELELFLVQNGDCASIAKTLRTLFGADEKNGGGITITPDPDTNSIMVRAPESRRLLIGAKIKELDNLYGDRQSPKRLALKFAKPTDVAETLRKIFLTNKSLKQQVTIEGDDNSKTLFVSASDEMYKEMQNIVEVMDTPSNQTVRVFKLEHAMASDIEKQLKTMVQQLMVQVRGKTDETFAFTSDPRTNTIIATGSPAAMLIIESVLSKIDTPPADASTPTTVMFPLTKGKAASVASTINSLYRGQQFPGGVAAPTAVAEPNSNVVYITGTKNQIDQIKATVIDPLEQYEPSIDNQVQTYQIAVKHADVNQVAQTLSQYFANRQATLRSSGFTAESPADTVMTIQPNPASRQLIVSCSPKNKELIDKLLAPMDVEQMAGEAREVKVYYLQYAHPSYVANVISNTYSQSGSIPESEQVRVSAEYQTMSLVVSALPSKLEQIDALVEKLDKDTAADRATEIVKLENARASSVANTINQILNASKRRDIRGYLPASVIPDDSSNSVTINASADEMPDVVALVQKLDVAPEDGREVKVYSLQYAHPSYVAQVLSSTYAQSSTAPENEQVRISAEYQTMTLVVSATPEKLEQIDALVEKLDRDTTADRTTEIAKLKNAKASIVANTINQILNASKRRDIRGYLPASVIPDDNSNTLVINASQAEMPEIISLVEKLDVDTTDQADQRSIRVFTLRYAYPTYVVNMINAMFAKGGQVPDNEQIAVTYEHYTSTVIVRANEENMKKVADLIDEVDIETATKRETQIVHLEYARPSALAQTLNQILPAGKSRDIRGFLPASVFPDDNSNTLTVNAAETEMQDVIALIKKLDVKPDRSNERVPKAYLLKYADIGSAVQAINTSFSGRSSANIQDQVEAAPIWATNTVVVTASTENHQKVQALINELDKETANAPGQFVLAIEHADANDLARALMATYRAAQSRQRGGSSISITAENSTNSLLISSSQSDFEGIKKMVAELDRPATEDLQEIRIIPLEYMDASEALSIMNDYLAKPNARGRRGQSNLVGNIKLSASQTMNTLIVSGAAADLDRIVEEVRKMDTKVQDTGTGSPQLIPLKHASAQQMVGTLKQMFVEPAQRDPRSRKNPELVPMIMANEHSNSLVVRARQNDFRMIEDMAMRLDTETSGPTGVKIIPVRRQANLVELARTVERTINQGEQVKARQITGYKPAQVTIGVNERIPALVVGGSPELFDTVREVFMQFEEGSDPQDNTQRAIVVPLRNIQGEEAERFLRGVIEQQQGGQSGNRGGRRSYRRR